MRKQSGRPQSAVTTVKIGERVNAMGKRGTVKAILDMNHVSVELDGDGGTFRCRLREVSRMPARTR
ncbi:MAG TPA: hypothetical protein VED01_13295 [Burkholderiales bacterium]|nr:hypothetical protein [Burkholderiales bacterium]